MRVWDALPPAVRAQAPDAYLPPHGYVCYRATGPVAIDGKLDDAAWQAVPRTEDFVDILEMNALNIVWDLRLKKPYRDGGKAEDAWDIPGLKTAVHLNGTINNPRIEATAGGFQASVDIRLAKGKRQRWSIREDSLVWLNR